MQKHETEVQHSLFCRFTKLGFLKNALAIKIPFEI